MQGFGKNAQPFIPSLRFLFFKRRLACTHSFDSLCQDQCTVAQRAEMTVAKCSPTSCVYAPFQTGSQTMPGQRHSQPAPTLKPHKQLKTECITAYLDLLVQQKTFSQSLIFCPAFYVNVLHLPLTSLKSFPCEETL